jgi:hypothetical protein
MTRATEIKNSTAYDTAIRETLTEFTGGEAQFFELALEVLAHDTASWAPRPVIERPGWKALEAHHAKLGQDSPANDLSRRYRRVREA